jgi:hypothetical protein
MPSLALGTHSMFWTTHHQYPLGPSQLPGWGSFLCAVTSARTALPLLDHLLYDRECVFRSICAERFWNQSKRRGLKQPQRS